MVSIVEYNLSTGHKETLVRMSNEDAARKRHAERLAARLQRTDTDHICSVERGGHE